MDIEVTKDIRIDSNKIAYVISFHLSQTFNAHHVFELQFGHDRIGVPGLIELEKSRNLIGKSLTASFGYADGTQQTFAGIVTKIELKQTHGYHGVLVAKGYSSTILIDRGPDLGSYYNKTLAAIINAATRDTPANDLKLKVNPDRKKAIDYMIQYQESDFDFLNRLSAEYYEWFFYDGEYLMFGKPDKMSDVSLVYGRDVQSLKYGIDTAPLSSNTFSYDPQTDKMLVGKSNAQAIGRPDHSHAIRVAGKLFSKTYHQSSAIRLENNADLQQHVKRGENAAMSGLMKISGRSDNPTVRIGAVAAISMSLKEKREFKKESLGQFLITAVSHVFDDEGRYYNTFEGINSTAEHIQPPNFKRPTPDMVLAEVFDNADPQNQGRIRVRFMWLSDINDPTEWLRVVTPDAGSSSKVSKNRGMVFIPEKGDQVIVSFEDGNIARPIVMGSVFNGKNGVGGRMNNDIKSLTTKSGHTLAMDDSNGILLKDKTDQNYISIDGRNAITINTDNNITLQTGKVMIIMDKKADKIIMQAKNIEIRASDDFKLTGDGAPVGNGVMEFDKKLLIFSKDELSLIGESTTRLNGKKVSISGGSTNIDGKPVKINS